MNLLKGFWKKGLAFVITALMIMTLLPITAYAAAGDVYIEKSAAATSTPGQYEITIDIWGEPTSKPSDVVLVIDRSLSMNWNMAGQNPSGGQQSRLTIAKNAAKTFVDRLLEDASVGNRIAVVDFSTSPRFRTADGDQTPENSDFLGSSNKAALYSAIDGITADGYTNIQGGIYYARRLLNAIPGSRDSNKYIVLLSDGEANRSYQINRIKAGSASVRAVRRGQSNNWDYYLSNFEIESFSYSSTVTNANNDIVNNYSVPAGPDYPAGTTDMIEGHTHGKSAIREAEFAKNDGYGIFSVALALDAGSEAYSTLNSIQNKGMYAANNATELQAAYEAMAESIKAAGTNAVMTDIIENAYFTFVPGTVKKQIGDGSVTSVPDSQVLDESGAKQKIVWSLGDITATHKKIMFRVQIVDGLAPGWYPTNFGNAVVNYINIAGQPASKEDDPPQVQVPGGKITVKAFYSDADGNPIDISTGAPAASIDDAVFNTNVWGQDLALGTNYTVSAPAAPDGTTLVTDSSKTVKPTAADPEKTVYFGYAPQQTFSVYH